MASRVGPPRGGHGGPWWGGWLSVLALALLLAAGLLFQYWPDGKGWRALGGACGALGTLLWPVREYALAKRNASVDRQAESASIKARKDTVDAARRAITRQDPAGFFHDMCMEAERAFADAKVRVGVYVLERTALDVDEKEAYNLALYGENDGHRGMSKIVAPDDPRGSHQKMVERALNRVPLVVPDVTKRHPHWDPIPATGEQRSKYMSFISIPIEQWTGHSLPAEAPAAGLLCIDSLDVEGLTDDDADLVRSLALVMSVGLNAIWSGHRVAVPTTPAASHRLSAQEATVRIIRTRHDHPEEEA